MTSITKTAIAAEFGDIASIKQLSLKNRQIRTFTDEILAPESVPGRNTITHFRFFRLRKLDLSNNAFTNLADQITSRITAPISWLVIAFNKITSLEGLSKYRKTLVTLNATGNAISEIPVLEGTLVTGPS